MFSNSGRYVQMETFGRGRGLPFLLIGGVGKAIRLHFVAKRLKTNRDISVFHRLFTQNRCSPLTTSELPVLNYFVSFFFLSPHFCFAIEAPCFYLHHPIWTLKSTVQSIRRLAFPACTRCVGIPPRAKLHSAPPNVPCLFACVIVFSSVEYWLTYEDCQKQGKNV